MSLVDQVRAAANDSFKVGSEAQVATTIKTTLGKGSVNAAPFVPGGASSSAASSCSTSTAGTSVCAKSFTPAASPTAAANNNSAASTAAAESSIKPAVQTSALAPQPQQQLQTASRSMPAAVHVPSRVVAPTPEPRSDLLIVVNGKKYPLLDDGRFALYTFFGANATLYDAASPPSRGGKNYMVMNEPSSADYGVTRNRLRPFCHYVCYPGDTSFDTTSPTAQEMTCLIAHNLPPHATGETLGKLLEHHGAQVIEADVYLRDGLCTGRGYAHIQEKEKVYEFLTRGALPLAQVSTAVGRGGAPMQLQSQRLVYFLGCEWPPPGSRRIARAQPPAAGTREAVAALGPDGQPQVVLQQPPQKNERRGFQGQHQQQAHHHQHQQQQTNYFDPRGGGGGAGAGFRGGRGAGAVSRGGGGGAAAVANGQTQQQQQKPQQADAPATGDGAIARGGFRGRARGGMIGGGAGAFVAARGGGAAPVALTASSSFSSSAPVAAAAASAEGK